MIYSLFLFCKGSLQSPGFVSTRSTALSFVHRTFRIISFVWFIFLSILLFLTRCILNLWLRKLICFSFAFDFFFLFIFYFDINGDSGGNATVMMTILVVTNILLFFSVLFLAKRRFSKIYFNSRQFLRFFLSIPFVL